MPVGRREDIWCESDTWDESSGVNSGSEAKIRKTSFNENAKCRLGRKRSK